MKMYWILILTAVSGLILIMTITILYAAGAVLFKFYTMLVLAGTLLWFGGILFSNMVKKRLSERDKL